MQNGKVYCWRGTGPAAGSGAWHLAFDPAGHARVLTELRSLRESGDASATVAFDTRPPSASVRAAVGGPARRATSPARLRVAKGSARDDWRARRFACTVS